MELADFTLAPPPQTVFLGAESMVRGNGGMCRVARLIARVLVDEGIAADVLTLSDANPDRNLGLAVRTAAGSRLAYVAGCYRAGWNHGTFVYDSLGMARAHCRLPLFRRPFAAWVHGIEVWENMRRPRRAMARSADLLFCSSGHTRERADALHGGFAGAKVCWPATEDDGLPADAGSPDGPPTVLILARIDIDDYKGHGALIACWPKVVSAVPDARLLVVGGGPNLDTIRQQAARSPARHRIEVRGFVPEEQIVAIWRQATVFAMPSRGEGFGLVYIEAMRFGLPVIASVHDAAPEVNIDGESGYNVDLERPEELPDRLVHLLRNRDHAHEMGLSGQARWAKHFRYGAFRRRFAPLLKAFIES